MTTQHRHQLSRLAIPPQFQAQQTVQPMYSPSIPTAIHQGYQPPFHPQSALQTPMQGSFFPQPPGAPGRPVHMGHRAHPSLALAAAGIHPPMGMPMTPGGPMTPLGPGQFPPGVMVGPPFMQRGRRQPSISTGGPPKAQLGGAGKNYRPASPTNAVAAAATATTQKPKKGAVSLPQETIPGTDGERATWARTPIPEHLVPPQPVIAPLEASTSEIYPPDFWRHLIPDTVDVFLPGKASWDDMKKRVIEEKLEKLGVEKGTGSYSSVPHIHAPHARAASISSPADPALLYFKLNKLQQSQNISQPQSASTSPQPPQFSSTPPTGLPPRLQNRHGHSLSLAAPPFQPSRSLFNPLASFNPFGPGATLGSDAIEHSDAVSDPGAPTDQSLAPPQMPARADSRPNFVVGFGLDIPEEEEPEEEGLAEASHVAHVAADETVDMDLDVEEDRFERGERGNGDDEDMGSVTTAAQSRLHSRHVSRLSAALSLLSVGGQVPGHEADAEDIDGDADGEDAVGEWTGSEDLRTTGETSDDESIGEWSNPSDEERARQDRLHRRLMRRSQHHEIQTPRRLPNFPHPPKTTPYDALAGRNGEIDDMLSNPSEEERRARPLPSLPGSRPGTAPLSAHDPALAHSRRESENFVYPGLTQNPIVAPIAAPAPKRGDSLNPLAKPFVFGASRLSGSWAPGTFAPSPVQHSGSNTPGHARVPSLGKPLNAAAAEFKPGSFTFRPPVDGPKFTFPAPVPAPAPPVVQARASPSPPPNPSPVRASQGREKRQRRGSMDSRQSSDSSDDQQEAMTSFKFPPESPQNRRSAPPSPSPPRRNGTLSATARPFTLPSHANNGAPFAIKEPVPLPHPMLSPRPPVDSPVTDPDIETDAHMRELPIPPSTKQKRAPIPLDFKHPVSTNTVPAGLFKALGNTDDERTRRTVRSRLSSREIFEHVSRPSLDDLNVPAISQNVSRGRLVSDPVRWDAPQQRKDVFTPAAPKHKHRRSSLPADGSSSSISAESILQPMNISRRLEMQQYEERLEALLDEKIESLRLELHETRQLPSGGAMNPSTEAKINEVVSLFRTQLQESAAHGLEDSQADARGELDFQLIKDIVEQGHSDARAMIQNDFADLVRRLDHQSQALSHSNIQAMVDEFQNRTRNTVIGVVSQLGQRLEAMERDRARTPHGLSALDREGIVREMLSSLLPHIAAMRPQPIDYEGLTDQLTQAVKPHISQLIDLASDKRETASLIVDRLIPVLPTIYPPTAAAIDTSAIIAQITNEVRRIIAPVDAHEIKEQVSDLVVERLDSRLAVRDRVLDTLSGRVTEGVGHLLEPMRDVSTRVDELAQGQKTLATQTRDLAAAHRDVVGLLADLPERLQAATDALGSVQADALSKGAVQSVPASDNILRIESTVDLLSDGQESLASKTEQLLTLHQELLSHLSTLPEGMAAISALHAAQAELLARSVTKQDFEEMRKMMSTNADLQVQLAKARAQHGAARAEKDMLLERVTSAETERDRLRTQVDEIQASMISRATDAATADARNAELEEALAQSLDRLKASDVTISTQQERIIELDNLNRELTTEKQALMTKVHAAETQAGYTARDKEALADALSTLQKEHDGLLAQQSHWDDLRRASEQIEQLASIVKQSNEPELRDLRRIRDRSKVLEGEYAALQRRFKDQETRATSSDRAATTARQSLTQAQQRSVEWEQRAKEYEVSLVENQAKLDTLDERLSQMDADYSLAKMQLDEKDAQERLAKDRESKLRDQIAKLEAKVSHLQTEASKKAPTAHSPPRPDSRASTVYPSRAATPTAPNGRSYSVRTHTPPQSQTSVWDSMHAPAKRYPPLGNGTPKVRGLPAYSRKPIASPTMSVVSLAPTQGDDGWWE
ncbi:hypothetical protein BV25DRAFT_1832763 [Artomyces pyxidatus]|uniref:Uncharacterized protein n=1 Tax=Artomyces pyxidatus TaxID=48021 RepID=A0ACB8SHR0_9AGAM|nr:hypothetical protein BV25DRAFT_1832763 [Artomyces pyxidatus]